MGRVVGRWERDGDRWGYRDLGGDGLWRWVGRGVGRWEEEGDGGGRHGWGGVREMGGEGCS